MFPAPEGYRPLQEWIDYHRPSAKALQREDSGGSAGGAPIAGGAGAGAGSAAALPGPLEAPALIRGPSMVLPVAPSKVSLRGSSGWDFLNLEWDTARVSATSRMPTVVGDGVAITAGKWYYEVQVEAIGYAAIGMGDDQFFGDWTENLGVGDDIHSWCLDIKKNVFRTGGKVLPLLEKLPLRSGDFFGIHIDADNGLLVFTHNGAVIEPVPSMEEEVALDTATNESKRDTDSQGPPPRGAVFGGMKWSGALKPAVSLKPHTKLRFNFGESDFFFAPLPGFRSMHAWFENK